MSNRQNQGMDFILVNAPKRTVERHRFKVFPASLTAVGLVEGHIDFGALSPRIHMALYEFGLYVPKEKQHYFSINRGLYAGNAVLFETDEAGDTISTSLMVEDRSKAGANLVYRRQSARLVFYDDWRAVEAAIARGEIDRPQMAINGEVLWRWPEPNQLGVQV